MNTNTNNTQKNEWVKAHPKTTGLLSVLFLGLLIWIVVPSSDTKVAVKTETKEVQKTSFDVPSLIGKNIDEVATILGTPKNSPEPKAGQLSANREWEKNFEKDGSQLLVTYNYDTKKVKDFFVSASDEVYENRDKEKLLKITNTNETDIKYAVSFVKSMRDSSRFTGILVTPKE
jgi:hypothetical protein